MIQRTYEIYVQIGGRTKIEATFGEGKKEQALTEAKRLYGERHISNVKVVFDSFNTETNSSAQTVVFDTASPEKERTTRQAPQKPAAKAEKEEAPDATYRAAPKKKPASSVKTVLYVVVLLAAIFVLAIVLKVGSQMWSSI